MTDQISALRVHAVLAGSPRGVGVSTVLGYCAAVAYERDRLLQVYRERVAAYAGVDSGFAGRWTTWCRTVLTHGGDLVVPPMHPEPDLDELLNCAEPHGPQVTFLDVGGDCHANVASLWAHGDIDMIGTGYALTEDLWRQHSWGLTGDGTVVESKHIAEQYVGTRLASGEPTVKFVMINYPDDIRNVLKSGTDRANEILRVIRASIKSSRDGTTWIAPDQLAGIGDVARAEGRVHVR
jgi:hypothetical protein